MFRNQYDTDVTTWSPQGRLFQIEYAMEAVKQGSCAVGITSKTHAVLATVNRTQGELSSTLKKIFKVDDHMGIAMSGVTADGRIMCRFMRNECINYRFVYESAFPVGRLVREVADKCQVCTQRSWQRPYGVGLLVAGVDLTGPHLYQTCPSGQFWQYKAIAIGARSQAARTYLERKVDEFPDCEAEGLIQHALFALQASLQDGDVNTKNVVVSVVSKDSPFTILEGTRLEPFLAQLEQDQPEGAADIEAEPVAPAAGDGAPEPPAASGDDAAPMES